MTFAKKKSLAWGMGKIEFRPLIPDISKLLAEEWPKKAIYKQLKAKGKLTMGYRTFCSFVRKLIPATEGTENINFENRNQSLVAPVDVPASPGEQIPPSAQTTEIGPKTSLSSTGDFSDFYGCRRNKQPFYAGA